jgi:peptidoglycan/xylan/chitin deacetylase (PgdA/CDA1 family)
LQLATQLKSLGHSISFRSGISAIMALRQRCARIIMYHGIPVESATRFLAQMRYLARHFRVVSLGRIVECLAKSANPSPDEIVLTFDDGLRNHATVVYPVLRELGIPATFFVCPGIVGTGRWLWNHEARCRLQTLNQPKLTALAGHMALAGSPVENIVEWMKTLAPARRLQAEEMIREATPAFIPTEQQEHSYGIMDWEQLRSLNPQLITIGSHTLTHPILTVLEHRQIDFELVEGRRLLEQELQRPVEYFCYPNGSHDPRVRQAVATTYRAAVTTESGTVDGRSHDLHLLPRIPSAVDPALMAWRLYRPGA